MKELIAIQQELVAPKSQWNNHGKFNYRSCEDILEGLKEPLKKQDCCVIISDELVLIGERYYIKATSYLYKNDGKLIAESTAFAREPDNQKNMHAPQLSGSVGTYARKYSLNSLFLIDDARDPDAIKQPKNDQESQGKKENKDDNLRPDGLEKTWLNESDKKNWEWAKKKDIKQVREYFKVSKAVASTLEGK